MGINQYKSITKRLIENAIDALDEFADDVPASPNARKLSNDLTSIYKDLDSIIRKINKLKWN